MLLTELGIVAILLSTTYASQATRRQWEKRSQAPSCSQYMISGSEAGYFENYRFWDFTGLNNQTSSGLGENGEPPPITSRQNDGNESFTSPYFTNSTFAQDWMINTGIRNPDSRVPMTYSAQNIWISPDQSLMANQTSLGMRTTRLSEFQSMAAMRTRFDILHASVRTRLMVVGEDDGTVASGAVVGFFTYASDTQESDVEILTEDPLSQVRFTNQPAGRTIPGVAKNMSLPGGKRWTDWTDYRLDWFPGRSVWYADDQLMLESTLSVPTNASALVMNLWSNGGTFSGTMDIGREVKIAVQWIEMAFNVSDGGAGGTNSGSHQACTIDGVSKQGAPEAISGSAGLRSMATNGSRFLAALLLLSSLVRLI